MAIGYKLNHATKQIEITKGFNKKAQTVGTKEFTDLASLVSALPTYEVVEITATGKRDTLTLLDIEKAVEHNEELKKEFKRMTTEKVKNSKGKEVRKYGFFEIKKWYKGLNL